MATLEDQKDPDPKSKILAMLDENRIMSIATVRPDGWPQATMVGYVHDDLTLYFSVARASQKLANIQNNPRVSVAIGHDSPKAIRGLSMAGHASEVMDLAEVGRLNGLIAARYPEQAVFAPREVASVILKFAPQIVSIIDLTKGPGRPELAEVSTRTFVRPIDPAEADEIMRERSGEAFVRPVSMQGPATPH